MRKGVKAFSDSLLDLLVQTDETTKYVKDFWGRQELLYLGPDEQVKKQPQQKQKVSVLFVVPSLVENVVHFLVFKCVLGLGFSLCDLGFWVLCLLSAVLWLVVWDGCSSLVLMFSVVIFFLCVTDMIHPV